MTDSMTDSRGQRKGYLRFIGYGLGLSILYALNSAPGFAQESDPLDRKVELNISAASGLEDALIEIGVKGQLAILINTSDVKKLSAKPLRGVYTARQALDLLLRGSGLDYSEDGGRVRIIQSVTSKRLSWDGSGSDVLSASDYGDQNVPANTAPHSPDNKPEGGLQQVIVTAERREESAASVPISITAFNQQQMDQLNIVKMDDLAAIAPGLSFTPPNAGYQDGGQIAIRGVYSNGNSPTTQVYIDETPIAIRQIPIANSMTPNPYIFDLDHVEVLRGPQGTLFGQSAMGGAIRFITPQPNMSDSSGVVKADVGYTLGGSPSYELGAAYGAPIVEGAAGYRLSAWFQWKGGFIDREDPFTGQVVQPNANTNQTFVVRPAFTFVPTEGLSVTPALFWQRRHDGNSDSYWVNDIANNENGSPVWGGIRGPLTDEFRIPSLAVKYETGNLLFQSDTSYLDRELTSTDDFTHWQEYFASFYEFAPNVGQAFIPGLESFKSYEEDKSYTHASQQEFRLSSKAPVYGINWIVGAFYRRARTGLSQAIPPDLTPLTEALGGETSLQAFGIPDYDYNGQQLNAYANSQVTDVSEALFGDVSVNLTSALKLDAGVRVEHLAVEHQVNVSAGPLNGGYNYGTLLDDIEKPVTPKASLTYQITDAAMVYASAAKGYRPGGGNNPLAVTPNCDSSAQLYGYSSVPKSFGSDKLWSFEVGTKDLFFDRRVAVFVSAYYIDWTKIQTGLGLPYCGEFFYANVGKAISQGFDLQVNAAVTHDFTVGAYVGYTDAYYPNATYSIPGQPSSGLVIGPGEKIEFTVPWTATVNWEYKHDLGGLWNGAQGYIRSDYRWTDAIVPLDPNIVGYDPIVSANRDPAYGLLNMRIGAIHDGLELSAYANNLTRAHPQLGFSHEFPSEPFFFASTVRPLTVGLTTWYRF